MVDLRALITGANGLIFGYSGAALQSQNVEVARPAVSQVVGRRRRLVVGTALLATDALVALVALAATESTALIVGQPLLMDAGDMHLLSVPVLACLIFGMLGLYGGYGPSPAERLRLRSLGVVILSLGVTVFLAGSGTSPSTLAGVTVMAPLLIVFGFYAEIAVRRVLIRRQLWGASTAIIGADEPGFALAQALIAQPELGFNPIGFVARASDLEGRSNASPLPILGTLETAPGFRGRIEVAIFCSSVDFAANEMANPGLLPFPRVVVAQQAQELQSLWLQTRTLGGVLGLEIRRDLYLTWNLRLKRLIDVLVAWPATLLVAPLIGFLALAIKRIDPGPAFYVQERVGRGGKPIRVLKLRSMYIDADQRLRDHLAGNPEARREWERFFKLSHDPRILPGIGNFIRRSSLDELPQLWNVARGDMSLVGPRPFPTYHLEVFDPDFQALRSSVSPGLTGLWQVSSRSNGDLATQKIQDSFYIRNWSIWLDLYILLTTVPAVMSGSGAR